MNLVLDIGTVLFGVALLIFIVFDIWATLSRHKTISGMIQEWGLAHRFWLLVIEGLVIGFILALAVHFLLP